MPKIKDVRAAVAVYTNKEGKERKKYQTVGALFESEYGLSMKLDTIPVGTVWDGWLTFDDPYEKKEEIFKEGMSNAKRSLGDSNNDKELSDDIPF